MAGRHKSFSPCWPLLRRNLRNQASSMDINLDPGWPQSARGRSRRHRDSARRRAGQIRVRQGIRRDLRRPLPAHRDVLSRQLRLHPAHVVGRRRSLRRAGRSPGAGGARRGHPLPPGRRAADGRRGRQRRENSWPCRSTTCIPFYKGIASFRDLPKVMCDQIAHFFQHYKDLEKGKWVTIVHWLDTRKPSNWSWTGLRGPNAARQPRNPPSAKARSADYRPPLMPG